MASSAQRQLQDTYAQLTAAANTNVTETNVTEIDTWLRIENKTLGWRHCKKAGKNRTNDLYKQLLCVRNTFEKNNIEHFINFGTLIGQRRHGGMNPFEGDNDVCLEEGQDAKLQGLAKQLFMCDLILFKHDIWRACTYSEDSEDQTNSGKPPWEDYVPYTDIYLMKFHPLKDPWSKWTFNKPWSIEKKNFGPTYMFTPTFADELLRHKYGEDWMANIPDKQKYS